LSVKVLVVKKDAAEKKQEAKESQPQIPQPTQDVSEAGI
jgi:hypothetical protein